MTPKTPRKTPSPGNIQGILTPYTAMCDILSPLIEDDKTLTPLPPLSPAFVSPLRDGDINVGTMSSQEWICPSTPPVLPATPSKSPLHLIVGKLLPFFDSRIKKPAAEPLTIGVSMKYGTTVNENGVRFSRRNVRNARNVKKM